MSTGVRQVRQAVSLNKILFYFKALVWESIILVLPPPTYKAYPIAILLHAHCAIYAPPPTPPLYAIHYTILVLAISCKGQTGRRAGRRKPWRVGIYKLAFTRYCHHLYCMVYGINREGRWRGVYYAMAVQ